MEDLSKTVAQGLVNTYVSLAESVHELAEKISKEQVWARPYPYGNSFGHLTLHIIGNLRYYIGTQMAHTGYIRDREREFTETVRISKADLLKELDRSIKLVVATLENQTFTDWSRPYEASGAPDFIEDRFSIFLRCATHFHHHIGQMIYLVKGLSK